MSAAARGAGRRGMPDAFVARRQSDWDQLDRLLLRHKSLHALPPADIARVGRLYRAVCSDLVHARGAGFPQELVTHLDTLAARAHGAIHRAEPYDPRAIWELLARDFPRTVRASWPYLAVALALLLVPLLIGLWATLREPAVATEVLPREQLEMLAQAYSEGFSRGRDEGTDVMMTGFYVHNNVGIAFRCFATGIFGGLGSVFFLVLNGLLLGVTFGWVSDAGGLTNLLTFVAGHGAFELTAIVIAGAAGLRMGYALVQTHGSTRLGSLRRHGPALARLVLGAALMLGVAALLEGFWSPSSLPNEVKWTVAAGLWLAVITYLARAGRTEPGRPRRARA